MNPDVLLEANRALASGNASALEAVLGRLETPDDAMLSHARGRVLGALGRNAEALSAHLRALELDPSLAAAHYSAGLLLAELNREDEAIRHWQEAVRLEPTQVDALYNLGQAMFNRGRFEAALEHWRAARGLVPENFEVTKKIVQVYNALDRDREADQAFADLEQLWRSSPDERVRAQNDVVIDQFMVAGHRVLVVETLRPRSDDLWDVTAFRVFDRDARLVLTVQLESGAYGRERGIPFVLSVRSTSAYRVLEIAFASKPPYTQLKPVASTVIEQELAKRPN